MNTENIWIAFIAASAGLVTALGLGKIVPAIIDWWNKKTEYNRLKKMSSEDAIKALNDRINVLENELDKHRAFETQTRATLNAMLPLMKEMMKDHPNYVSLLNQLENNIIGKITPSDGK